MPTQKLRVGIVGCGAVAERYHAPALVASPDVEVVACADPSLDRAHALADRVGGVATRDYRDLIGCAELALVAAPNAHHEHLATDLLAHGLHVLVEKPMARTAAECDRMTAAARAYGRVLAVGHDFRWFPLAEYAQEVFASGWLGRVRRVDVQQSAGGRWPYASTAALMPSAGGGVLLDFGVHMLDLLLWWLGELRPLRYRDDAVGGVETDCEIDLELAGGAPVRMDLSRSRRLRDTVLVECERGRVELGVFEPAVCRLHLDAVSRPLVGSVADREFDESPIRTVFGRQIADVVRAVRGEGPPRVRGDDGRRVVHLVETCYAMRERLQRPWDFPAVYVADGRGA